MSLHRCGETHRKLLRSKDYMQVCLQRGEERMTITCPRSMQTELRKCIANKQGYSRFDSVEMGD